MRKFSIALAIFGILLIPDKNWSQGGREAPSQKTKEAVEKFHKAPGSIGKKLEVLKNTAKAKLGAALGSKKPGRVSTDAFTIPTPRSEGPGRPRYSALGKRDPFRPMGFGISAAKVPSHCREENLSPLQQVNLSQLKLVGIVWKIDEPKAMVEDSTGLGYVIKLGTPIGDCQYDGKVKAIRRGEVVIEKKIHDPLFGTSKAREVNMKLPSD
ncbi:MAG: pilus assembly protein PilP [Candidatus Binatia bacterium]